MEFALPEELRMVRSLLRKFVDENVIPLENDYPNADGDEDLPKDVRKGLQGKLRGLGLWAIDVPQEHGGAGLGALGGALVTEETHRSVLSRTLIGGGADPRFYNASDYLKEKYLYPTVRGEKKCRSAYSEPGAGSDLAGIQTTAERVGDGYVLNGTKIWLSEDADYTLVLARMKGTKRREGMTWFVVDEGTQGLRITRRIPMMGHKTTIELLLDNCYVPEAQRLTPEGEAWGFAQESLNKTRVYIAGRCLGLAGRCIEMALSYAKVRQTFGAPLSDRQGVQFMLADAAIGLHATRMMMYHAAWRADRGEDVSHEASILKVFATEMAFKAIDAAMQIHGAAGYSKDMPIERFFRTVRAGRIYDGPNEIHRYVIARNLLRGYNTLDLT
jgi:acyl-CoA dehydrogenase